MCSSDLYQPLVEIPSERRQKLTKEEKAAIQADKAQMRAEFAAWRASKKRSNPHREERGYFYEVLNAAGKVVAVTTNKEEALDVCNNPKQLNLPKGTYSYRHIGGKKLVPVTSAGNRARRV